MSARRLTPEELQPCACCGKSPVHTVGAGLRLTIDRLNVDNRRAQAQAGLEMMLGGHAGIAAVMGDRAVIDAEQLPAVFICGLCMGAAELTDLVTHAFAARERAEIEAGR